MPDPLVVAATLSLVCVGLLAGCAKSPVTIAEDRPTQQVRVNRDAPLNADTNWLPVVTRPAEVIADQPFRLRLELAPSADLDTDCVQLQYRRNGGEWTTAEAHDFPYPLREREIEFARSAVGTLPAPWWTATGPADDVTVAQAGGDVVLLAAPHGQAVIGLYPAPWDVTDGFGFAAEYRVAAEAPGAVGLVFGWQDAANHWRLILDAAAGAARVIRFDDGAETVIAEHPAELRTGTWQEAEVALEDGSLAVNLNDDAMEFEVATPGDLPAAQFGFAVPVGGIVEFRGFIIEGEPSSPPLSIVSSKGYADGAATTDLLDGAIGPFVPGSGVNLDRCAEAVVAAGAHTELEWPLVVRRFADGAFTNESDDVFELRLSDRAGGALAGAPVARLNLVVPDGHLGGTFVETPGRIGPWQADNGDLYFIMEPTESDNLFMMVKSTDGGRTWREVDSGNRPATGDLESVDGRLVGDTIHILHQVTEATFYHSFRTADHRGAPDTWAVADELATEVTARAQMASLVVRPDGSMVAFHLGDTIGYSIRSAAGRWSDEILVESGAHQLAGPQAVLGADGIVHLAYYRMDGSIWHRRLLADDTLTAATLLAEGAGIREDDWGAVLPLVYLPQSDTLVVLYRLADGMLWERRIIAGQPPSSPVVAVARRVVQHAVDSQQAGADVIAYDGGLAALFIDEADRSIYSALHRGGTWEPPVLQVDGILGSWVRGNVVRRADGATVVGYVYDAGSFGGTGMNRYGELALEAN